MLQSLDQMATKKAGRPPEIAGPTKQKGVTLAEDVFKFIDDAAYEQRKPTAVLMREILNEWVERQRGAPAAPAPSAAKPKPRRKQ